MKLQRVLLTDAQRRAGGGRGGGKKKKRESIPDNQLERMQRHPIEVDWMERWRYPLSKLASP